MGLRVIDVLGLRACASSIISDRVSSLTLRSAMTTQNEEDKPRWPEDVVLLILKELETKDVFSASLVNKEWSSVAQQLLWNSISVSSSKQQLDAFCKAVASKKQRNDTMDIRELRLAEIGPGSAAFRDLDVFVSRRLRLLSVSSGTAQDVGTIISDEFKAMLKAAEYLETLELSGPFVDDGLLKDLVGNKSTKLTSLSIRHNLLLTNEGSISAIAAASSSLKLSAFDGTGTPALSSPEFLQALHDSQSSTLTSLTFDGDDTILATQLSTDSLSALAKFTQLKALRLGSQTKMQVHWIRLLIDSMPDLEELYLGYSFWIKDGELDYLVDKCKKIKKLGLRRILGISTPSLLKAVVAYRENLEYLDIAGTTSNVRFVIDVLGICSKLRKVVFRKPSEMGMMLGLADSLAELLELLGRKKIEYEMLDF